MRASSSRAMRVAARARDARVGADAPHRARDADAPRRPRGRRSRSRDVARRALWRPRARERDVADARERARDARRRETATETFAHEGATTATLGAWLARRGVATDKFDRARGTKNLEDLLIELKRGESVLVGAREDAVEGGRNGERDATAERCVRYVDVLTLRVRRPESNAEDGMCLIEKEQIFGKHELKRRRNRPLSEKMNQGEDWRDCVERAVREELGSALRDGYVVETLEDTYKMCVSEELSVSYPGLRSRFALHRVDAIVHGLPEEDEFQSEETTHRGVLRATWRFEEFRWPETDLGPA